MKRKSLFKLLTVCVCTGIIFVALGYTYLSQSLKPAKVETESEPYSASVPQNCGIVFESEEEKTFFYLDFEDEALYVLLSLPSEWEDNIHGYSVDRSVKGDYSLVADLVDMVDGIDLKTDGEELRYTGVQSVDLLSQKTVTKREVISAMAEKIAKNGFSKDGFIYIVENSQTDITVPDCYYWSDHIKEMCRNIKIID